jgi:hypothetical protein
MKTLIALLAAVTVTTTSQAATTAADAFASLKKLRGEWRGPAMAKGMPPSHSIYRVTAGGSAVEETIFPGTKMEMLSVYHMDRGNLLMTHYCALGNQPHVKLNTRKSTARELVFDYAGGTNLNVHRDQHMHSLTLTLPDPSKKGPQKLSGTGTSWKNGKQENSCGMTMTRVR